MIRGWGYRGGNGILSSPMIGNAFCHKNIFQIKTNIGKIYIIECMIYLPKYINITAIDIRIIYIFAKSCK